MRIQIRAASLALSKAQRATLDARLTFALARYGESIERVVVWLSRLDEPSGFVRCQITATARTGVLGVEHVDRDVVAAVEHAVSRLARSIGRSIEKATWSG
ncbi:MAG: HPF/RaiA family ribosome-associated protein [Proteobacteria bacterium]|nr:HPF/RaiA family ribosome-associated protein [Pseudomonadota bacterium]